MKHVLPTLDYAYGDLAPYIDARTMEIHYTKHHQAYVDNLNKAITGMQELQDASLEDIMHKVGTLPAAIRNNGGGHYNHSLFWKILSPAKQEIPAKLSEALVSTFGSIDAFKSQFAAAAMGRFGSGWAWLIVDQQQKLAITSSPNQDNPIMDIAEVKGIPILGLDVWEHAYYLNYQNKRADYVNAFWDIVNWDTVSTFYESAIS